ncbi:hypothetical protein PseAD21_26430 [Pseudomonas sp. AD21]|uniref:FitA-like ribbon-helix-helix domain-containing protein n=1 Tax=Pseudomonas sp. AD21 TaxID=396378 RepID=UPI000C8218EF|nr:plasmid stabilization protein [Pseudomonas sp. AD21]PMQ07960.1 hypothetical protein PseAD21_26430 [Pseudomonas sp. AD21]
MTSITIRLDEQMTEQLRIAAAHNCHFMEDEARRILENALATVDQASGLGTRIRNRFGVMGGVELDLPSRSENQTPLTKKPAARPKPL